MPGRDIIVIGGSAGAIQAIQEIARALPADFPAAVFVVIHTAPTSPGVLSRIIDDASPLPAAYATDGEPVRFGRIHVAPPDHHLLLLDHHVRVTRGPRENGFRPAVDPLFRTAAAAWGNRVVGVILSGGLDDGTLGLAQVRRAGGVAVVQDPIEAVFPGMPQSAIRNVAVDHVLPIARIAGTLIELAGNPARGGRMPRPTARNRTDTAVHGDHALKNGTTRGAASGLTCPECGGALWERAQDKLLHYQCHVGHAYTPDGLVAAQSQDLEAALWSALRALEENAELRRRMADRARKGDMDTIARAYDHQAAAAEHQADAIRAVLTDQHGNGAFAPPATGAGAAPLPKTRTPPAAPPAPAAAATAAKNGSRRRNKRPLATATSAATATSKHRGKGAL